MTLCMCTHTRTQALMSWCPSSKAHGPPASAKSVLDALKNVLKVGDKA
jgi:hypothetical protein